MAFSHTGISHPHLKRAGTKIVLLTPHLVHFPVVTGCSAYPNLEVPGLQQCGGELFSAPVVLGGEIDKKLSDAWLYSPDRLAPAPKDQIATGGLSRMPDCTGKMTAER